jgi:hypothetical protein
MMNPQKVLNNSDQNREDITELMTAANDSEHHLNSSDLLNVFKKNLEILRDNYLQLTESDFDFELSDALEHKTHHSNSADHLQADWVSRDALLNEISSHDSS